MIIREDYLKAAAKAVTGFDITVRHRKTAIVGTRAICHQSIDNGERFIDLNPNMPREIYFFTFLHECAHWKIKNGELLRSDVNKLEPGSLDIPGWGESEKYKAGEAEADALAEKWDAWAEANANHNFLLVCPELSKAIALTQYETT